MFICKKCNSKGFVTYAPGYIPTIEDRTICPTCKHGVKPAPVLPELLDFANKITLLHHLSDLKAVDICTAANIKRIDFQQVKNAKLKLPAEQEAELFNYLIGETSLEVFNFVYSLANTFKYLGSLIILNAAGANLKHAAKKDHFKITFWFNKDPDFAELAAFDLFWFNAIDKYLAAMPDRSFFITFNKILSDHSYSYTKEIKYELTLSCVFMGFDVLEPLNKLTNIINEVNL